MSVRRPLGQVWMAMTLAVSPATALAYIDPNTGGLIFQMLAPLLAMIASAWLFARDTIKGYWYRLFGRKKPSAAEPDQSPADKKTSGTAP